MFQNQLSYHLVVCLVFEFLIPFTLTGRNFLILICFSGLLVCQMRREEDFKSCFFKFCLDTRNNGGLPLDPACLEDLSVQSSAGLPYHIIRREKRHCSCTSRCRLRSTCGGVVCAERMLPDPSSPSIPVLNSPFAAPKQQAEDSDVPLGSMKFMWHSTTLRLMFSRIWEPVEHVVERNWESLRDRHTEKS